MALEEYRRKRNFKRTPEPGATKAKPAKRLRFVVQMHDASRLHWDFRLEADGVLASWAGPKGPTLVALDKRLAMHVEDHPMAYRDFEGNIPKGEYGAGSVIVWDRGTYELAEGTDPVTEIAKGKIKFVLHGEKLRGLFSLVKIKPREDEKGEPWLLFDPKAATWHSHPVERATPKARTRATVPHDPLPVPSSPMLASLVDAPFDNDDWLFELKWDGYRAICTVDERGKLSLRSRNGNDLLRQFPDLSDLASAFAGRPIVVDGEIVSLDAKGRSDFQRLQEYPENGAQLTFVAFDLLYADGHDLRDRPLAERKTLLDR